MNPLANASSNPPIFNLRVFVRRVPETGVYVVRSADIGDCEVSEKTEREALRAISAKLKAIALELHSQGVTWPPSDQPKAADKMPEEIERWIAAHL